MQFRRYVEDTQGMAIFLDLDETLVYTSYYGWGYDQYDSTLRPGAREFLRDIRQFKVPVYVITHGITDFQVRICKEHRIFNDLDGLWGRDEYHRVPKTPNAVLVDDRDVYSPYTQLKLKAINLGERNSWGLWETDRLVQVSHFRGQPDNELLGKVLPALTQLLV